MFYGEGLAAAYTHGDLSATYPVACGGGALLAAVGGVALLDDHLSVPAWIALGIVAVGLVSIRGPGGTAGLGWAAFTGSASPCTRSSTRTAREADSAIRYGLATILRRARRLDLEPRAASRRGVAGRVAAEWRRWMVGGAAATAYTLVLAAVRLAPGRLRDRAARVLGGARRAGRLARAPRGHGRSASRPPASSSPGSCCSWSSACSPGSARVLGPGSCLRIFPAGLRARRPRPRAARGWPGCAGPSPSGSPASR